MKITIIQNFNNLIQYVLYPNNILYNKYIPLSVLDQNGKKEDEGRFS